MYIDSHVHLDDSRLLENIDEHIAELKAGNVEFVINASCGLKTQAKTICLAEKYRQIYALIGNHCHEAKFFNDEMIEAMIAHANHKKVVGVGEIGLDFHYDFSPRDVQRNVFEQQLVMADKFKLPVVLHIREAYGEVLEIIKAHKKHLNSGVLLHCYSGSAESVKEYSRLCDCYFSFGGAITFKNAKKDDVIKVIPVNRILTETDAPYLTPEPFRGRLNKPIYVRYVLEKIAEVLDKESNEMQDIVISNTLRLFTRIKL